MTHFFEVFVTAAMVGVRSVNDACCYSTSIFDDQCSIRSLNTTKNSRKRPPHHTTALPPLQPRLGGARVRGGPLHELDPAPLLAICEVLPQVDRGLRVEARTGHKRAAQVVRLRLDVPLVPPAPLETRKLSARKTKSSAQLRVMKES